MSFRDRLTESIPTLAAKLGCDRTWLYRVIEEQSPCGKRLAKQIEAETHGAIRAVWLLGLEVPPAQSESPKTEAA